MKPAKNINGIESYAPSIDETSDDYPPGFFDRLYHLEDRNFWFRSRNRILQHLFKKFLGDGKRSIMELGCGTGYVLQMLAENPGYHLVGLDIHTTGLLYAKKRLPQVRMVQADARELPFENEFDAVGAFDVLEHIKEDELVMRQIHRSLKKDGLFFISVPQHMFLWSANDDLAHHQRRYSRNEMKTKLENAGFTPLFLTSFITTLFPLMLISRAMHKKSDKDDSYAAVLRELDLPPVLNSLFEIATRIDEWCIRCGISLPIGGSLIAVAKKI